MALNDEASSSVFKTINRGADRKRRKEELRFVVQDFFQEPEIQSEEEFTEEEPFAEARDQVPEIFEEPLVYGLLEKQLTLSLRKANIPTPDLLDSDEFPKLEDKQGVNQGLFLSLRGRFIMFWALMQKAFTTKTKKQDITVKEVIEKADEVGEGDEAEYEIGDQAEDELPKLPPRKLYSEVLKEGLHQEGNGLLHERDGFSHEKDGLSHEKDGLPDEGDDLLDEGDDLLDEGDGSPDKGDELLDKRGEIQSLGEATPAPLGKVNPTPVQPDGSEKAETERQKHSGVTPAGGAVTPSPNNNEEKSPAEQLIEMIETLQANIRTQKNRRNLYNSEKKINWFQEIINKINPADSSIGVISGHIEEVRKVCGINRNWFHLFNQPISVGEFEKLLQDSELLLSLGAELER